MKRLIKYIILFVFVCVGNVTWAEEGERESSLFPDSSYVLRGPKADFLEKYRKDAAFDYTTNIEDSPSIWDWIKRWILERLFRIKVSEGSMQTMDIILKIVLGLFALGIVYLLVRNRDKFLFRRRETDFFPEDSVEYTGEQEADSFVRLLAKAEQENDYVLAIRVSYSALLQMLDKKEVIRWDVSKTNQHYIYEIKNETWSRHFEEISRIFDCVCYGEFPVDETAYRNIKRYFTEFRKEVEGLRRQNVLIILFVIAIMAVYTGYEANKPQPIDWSPNFSISKKSPYGTYIIKDALPYLFPEGEVSFARMSVREQLRVGRTPFLKTYFFVSPFFKIVPGDLEAVLEEVEGGGALFVSAEFIPDTLYSYVGVSGMKRIQNGKDYLRGFEDKGYPFRATHRYFELKESFDGEVLGYVDTIKNPNFIRMNYGEGVIYLHSNPMAFTNFFLLDSVNGDYYQKALSFLPGCERGVG
ncbi:MAG: DUF4129 domain-containing protein [Butyricimonas paravirosa]